MPISSAAALALADKFVAAGEGNADIFNGDLAVIGIHHKEITTKFGWEIFCLDAYRKITGEPCPRCPHNSRGLRSQWFGNVVANAIRAKYATKETP